MDFRKLQIALKEAGEPSFRYQQIKQAFLERGVLKYGGISSISAVLADKLAKEIKPLSVTTKKIIASPDKRSFKALLKLSDGAAIETVLLSPLPGHWSVCVSSQAGCKLACRFCATGQNGFKRNLRAEEITDQILFWRNFIKKENLAGNFSNIVFMGMGEPFMNWPEVSRALKILIDPDLFNFASRHISVSTSGVVDGIRNLARKFPQVNLALSLVFADNKTRSKYMPINRRFGLNQVQKALEYYIGRTNRKVFLEYILFKDVNDKREHIKELTDFIKSIENGRKLLQINLIRYNTAVDGMHPSDKKTVEWFRDLLIKNKIKATIRKSLGAEIKGACGQLAGKSN